MSDTARANTPLSVSGVTWELIHGAMYQGNGPLAFIEFFADVLVGGRCGDWNPWPGPCGPYWRAAPARGRESNEGVAPVRSWSLARRLLVAQWALLTLITSFAVIGSFLQTRDAAFRSESASSLAVAQLAADDPRVAAAYRSADPGAQLQPISARIMTQTGSAFATFLDREGTRLTYHRPGYEGTHYSGTITEALAGRGFTETSSTATAGLSVRAVVPVFDEGRVVGALTVGTEVGAVSVLAASGVPLTLGIAACLALVMGFLSWWAARYLRRVTAGLGPEALARHFAVADAALLSVDEGIVISDAHGRIVFHNRAADALLHLPSAEDEPDTPSGLDPQRLGLPEPIAELIASGRRAEDEAHSVGRRVVVLRQQPLRRRVGWARSERGADTAAGAGAVLTVHDHTAVQSLAGELASTRSLTSALRAQNHDHANRLHTLLGLLEIDRAEDAHAMLRQSVRRDGTTQSAAVEGDVVLTALARAKSAEAAERGVELQTALRLGEGTALPPAEAVAIFGNLLDNAIDAAEGAPDADSRWVRLEAGIESSEAQQETGPPKGAASQAGPGAGSRWLVATVADGGTGFSADDAERIFAAGFSTKAAGPGGRGQGLAIVAHAVGRLGGTISAAADSGTVFTVEVPLPSKEEA